MARESFHEISAFYIVFNISHVVFKTESEELYSLLLLHIYVGVKHYLGYVLQLPVC